MKYKEAGVDIEKADKLVEWIKKQLTLYNKRSAGNIGRFAGKFPLSKYGLNNAFLYASVDGVGTKTKLAAATGNYEVVGYDIVSHCINDLMVQGANPLFFMDYIAMGYLNNEAVKKIFNGMLKCIKECNIILLGGETAEMPGIYEKDDFDLVGFIVGIGDRKSALPKSINKNDIIIGVSSTGLHTNGFSLVRKIIDQKKLNLDDYYPEINSKLSDALLKPHCCYFKLLKALLKENLIKAAVHVTGSGIEGNLKRVLTKNIDAVILKNSWQPPLIFDFIKAQGEVPEKDMFDTFNMGIGLLLITKEKFVSKCMKIIKRNKLKAFKIGFIEKGEGNVLFRRNGAK